MKKTLVFLTLTLVILIGCRLTEAATTVVLPTDTPIVPTETAVVPTETATSATLSAGVTNQPTETVPPAASDTPPATETDSQRTSDELIQNQPLPRDPIALAIAYDGVSQQPLPTRQPITEPLTAGTRQMLKVLNTDSIIINEIDAELKVVGDHAYFWFETDSSVDSPSARDLQEMADGFDAIYEQVISFFGSENNPGIDGDPRIHIVNADPGTVCDEADYCGLLGYFSASDIIPAPYDSSSNEREMFVMNGS